MSFRQIELSRKDVSREKNELTICRQALDSSLNKKKYLIVKNGILASLATLKKKVEGELNSIRSVINKIDERISANEEAVVEIDKNFSSSAIEEAQAKEGLIIHKSAQSIILYTLIGWGSIILVVVVAIILLNFFDKGSKTFSYALFLEMITVFLLTGTILILGIAGKLNQEGLAALIGGIAGYVLGRLKGNDRAEKKRPNAINTEQAAEQNDDI